MPFNVGDHQWANERFAGRDLRARNRFSLTDEVGNRLRVGSRHYVGEQFLGHFEGGLDSWQVVGEAITNHGSHQFYQDQLPIFGHVGPGFLTSYHPEEGAEPTRQGAFTDVHGLGWPLSCLADWRWIGGAQCRGPSTGRRQGNRGLAWAR